MPEDQTEFSTRGEGSQFAGISIRGWLAITVTLTVCATVAANMIMAMLGVTSVNVDVPEPLYSVFGMIIGMYFGQKNQHNERIKP